MWPRVPPGVDAILEVYRLADGVYPPPTSTTREGMTIDDDEFLRARDALVGRFRNGASPEQARVAELLLDFKHGYRDGRLTRWAADDLSQILLGLFPAKVLLDADELDDVVPAARDFMVWLHDEGLLEAGSDPLPMLRATLNAVAAGFAEAMRDTSRYGMGKSMAAAMASAGVDVEDAGAVQAWVDAHNALPFEERVAATGGPASLAGGPPLPSLPPFAPPPPEQIASAVEQSVFLQRARAFVEYVGDGRALTQKGNLTLADGRALVELLETDDVLEQRYGDKVHRVRTTQDLRHLDLLFHWLRAGGFVKMRKGRVEPTKAAPQLHRDPVAAWHRALDGLLKLGPVARFWGDREFTPPWVGDVDASLPGLLFALFESRDPVEIDALVESQWEWINESWTLDRLSDLQYEIWESATERDLRRVLNHLVDLGVVAIEGIVEEPASWGPPDQTGGTVQLTPLGRVGVHRLAAEFGVYAPTAGRLRDAAPAQLLAALSGAPPDEVDAEVRAWLTGRDPTAAAQEVTAALRTGAGHDDVEQLRQISVALAVWDQLGDPAAEAVRVLCDQPVVSPFAAAWLEVNELPGPPPDPGALLVGLAVMAPAEAIADLAAMPADQQLALFEAARANRWPGTQALLELVAAEHPD